MPNLLPGKHDLKTKPPCKNATILNYEGKIMSEYSLKLHVSTTQIQWPSSAVLEGQLKTIQASREYS